MKTDNRRTTSIPDQAQRRRRLHAFTNAFQPVRRAWLRAAAAAAAASGTSLAVATAMVLLAREGDGLQQNTLAEITGVNPAAMLRTLVQAEAAGLCERCTVPQNRRIKAVRLLPKGKALARAMERRLDRLRAELLGDVDAADIDTATRVLRLFESRILARLEPPAAEE